MQSMFVIDKSVCVLSGLVGLAASCSMKGLLLWKVMKKYVFLKLPVKASSANNNQLAWHMRRMPNDLKLLHKSAFSVT